MWINETLKQIFCKWFCYTSLTATSVRVIHSNGKSSASNGFMAGDSTIPGAGCYILSYYFKYIIQFLTGRPDFIE